MSNLARNLANRVCARSHGGSLAVLISIASGWFGLLGGCAKPAAIPSLPPASMPVVKNDTPENATKSALLLMQAELRSVAARDAVQTAKIHAELLKIVARAASEKTLRNVAGAKSLLGDDPVSGMAELWASAVAHYAERFDFSTISCPPYGAEDKQIPVYLVVGEGAGRADLRVDCVRENGGWLIRNITFEGAPPPVRIPISAVPASRSTGP